MGSCGEARCGFAVIRQLSSPHRPHTAGVFLLHRRGAACVPSTSSSPPLHLTPPSAGCTRPPPPPASAGQAAAPARQYLKAEAEASRKGISGSRARASQRRIPGPIERIRAFPGHKPRVRRQQHQKPKKTILPRVRPFRAHHEQAPSPLDAIPRRSYPRRAPTRSLSAPARSTSCTYPRLLCHTAALWLCAGRQRLQHVKLAPCRRLTPIPGTPPP